jgi:hypothetical protein
MEQPRIPPIPLQFGQWAPDASWTAGQLRQAKGLVSVGGRYRPIASATIFRSGSNLGYQAKGAGIFWTGTDGSNLEVLLGTDNGIYKLIDGDATPWNRVTTGGAYNASKHWRWRFAQFNDYIFAGNRGVPLQYYALGVTAPRFENVPDAEGDDRKYVPKSCSALFRVGQSLFAAEDRRLQWSAIGQPLSWVPDISTGANDLLMPSSGGSIMAGSSGEVGFIWQERAISRVSFVGPPSFFQIDEVDPHRGLLGPDAWCSIGRAAFMISEDGFYVFDGMQAQAIGAGRVDRYFASRLNWGYRHTVSCAYDSTHAAVMVAYPSGSSQTPNEVLIWSIADNKWTHDDITCDLVMSIARGAVTNEDTETLTDLLGTVIGDEVDASVTFDDPMFKAGRRQWALVDGNRDIMVLDGPARAATIETAPIEPSPTRVLVNEMRLLGDARAKDVTIRAFHHADHLGSERIEDAAVRANELLHSEALGSWTVLNLTALEANAAAPDGSTTATRLTETTATGAHRVRQTTAGPCNELRCATIRLRPGVGTTCEWRMLDAADDNNWLRAAIDLTDMTATGSAGGDAELTLCKLRRLRNGWVEVSLAGYVSDSSGSMIVELRLTSGGNASYAGNAAVHLWAWGAHLHTGYLAQPYLRTGAAAASRAGVGMVGTVGAPVLIEGQYVGATVQIEAGADWSDVSGLILHASPSGRA